MSNYKDERVLITPEWAMKTLKERRNDRNVSSKQNPVKKKRAEKMVQQASPQLSESMIKFDKTGRLMDGRHRIQAAAETGRSFWSTVRRYK